MTQHSKGRRRGDVFSVRLTPAERERIEAAQAADKGPRAIGPWLVWRAFQTTPVLPPPAVSGTTPPGEQQSLFGTTRSSVQTPVSERLILDLCSGTGSWSAPYVRAGYTVLHVELPMDVRTWTPPLQTPVWGILAAPPCTEFSIAKNGQERDLLEGMSCVNACMRIVLQCRPRWWALENPTGLLGAFLGAPTDVWEPCDFGDPWTKRTAIWGDFTLPVRRFVKPERHWGKDIGARTPPGFAQAFYEANP